MTRHNIALGLVFVAGVTALLLAMHIVNPVLIDYCTQDLDGRVTTSGRACLDQEGNLLDSR